MAQEQPKELQTALTLNEQQKQSVRALKRQLSVQSSSSTDTISSGHFVAKLSEEEIRLLHQVVQTFGSYKQTDFKDEVDGRKIERNFSEESYLSSKSWQLSGTYVNPGRFYVRIKEEEVRTLDQICIELDKEESDKKINNSNKSENSRTNTTQTESENVHPWGYTVVLTKQKPLNASYNDQIRIAKAKVTGAVPAESRPRHNNRLNVSNGSAGKHTTAPKSVFRRLPPRERFRQAVFLVINNLKIRPLRRDWDFSELWQKRGNATWLSIILTLVGIGAFFADIGTDLKVAADHFIAKSYWWGSFTVLLVLLPSLVTNLVSFFWYKEDEVHTGRKPKHGWTTVIVTHVFLVGLVERYWRILVKSFRIKRKKANRVVDNKLLIAMNLDVGMLQMILAFTEDAPQLVLQLYVLISRNYVDTVDATRIQDLWTILSICFSFTSYSRAVVNYISSLRDSKRSKGQLRWYGYLSMWLWRAFMIISRILVLVFFATEFKLWFFLVLFVHFFIVLAFLLRHEVYFFPGNRWKQHFIRAVMSYIHLFCFFCLEGVRTIRWAITYYVITFIENLVFSVLWYTNNTRHLPLRVELAGLIVIYTFFFAGLLMMTVYYKFLHPRFSRARFTLAAPMESELADQDSNEDADQTPRENFELWV